MKPIRTAFASLVLAAALAAPSLTLAEPALPYTFAADASIPTITSVQERDEVMRLLSAHLGLWSASSPEQYAYTDLLTDDAVFEYPLASDSSAYVAGKEAVTRVVRQLPGAATGWKFHHAKLFETPHHDVFFVEYRVTAYVPSTARVYEGRHIARITVRDGKIANYYELWDRDARALAFGLTKPQTFARLR
jgi:ketosteroid isomerase-like protein